jgi:protein ImuA
MFQSSSSDIFRNLAERIHEIELSQRPSGRSEIALEIPGFDRLSAGSLVELLSSAPGVGTSSLGLLMAKAVAGEQKAIVVVDPSKRFYPPAAASLGLDLPRAVVVRPKTLRDVFAACNLSLRCAAVGAVIAWCEPQTLECRRLQVAAEAGGSVGVLLRKSAALRTPSFAALRLLITPLVSPGALPLIRVEVMRRRGGKAGKCLILEIDHETGDVRESPELAGAKAMSREARTSG